MCHFCMGEANMLATRLPRGAPLHDLCYVQGRRWLSCCSSNDSATESIKSFCESPICLFTSWRFILISGNGNSNTSCCFAEKQKLIGKNAKRLPVQEGMNQRHNNSINYPPLTPAASKLKNLLLVLLFLH